MLLLRNVAESRASLSPRHLKASHIKCLASPWALGLIPQALRFLGWPRHRSIQDTHAFLQLSQRVLEKCGFVREETSTRLLEFPNLSPGVQREVLSYALLLGLRP